MPKNIYSESTETDSPEYCAATITTTCERCDSQCVDTLGDGTRWTRDLDVADTTVTVCYACCNRYTVAELTAWFLS
jgi:hypothetical protein